MPIRVLILSPDATDRLALRAQFEALECETRWVESVDQASRAISDAEPDALVVSLDDTTIGLVRSLKRRRADLAILALVPPEFPIDDALAAGVTVLVPLPLPPVHLYEAASELLLAVKPTSSA